jgi:hypothetical protein
MELAAHGQYTIEQKGNILFVDAHGPFNEVITQQFSQDMHQICQKFKDECWASLVTYYGNALYTPEAENDLITLTKYRARHGMIANASIIFDSSCSDIQQMQLRRIYQSANVTSHVFSDVNSAEKWLVEFMESTKQTQKA